MNGTVTRVLLRKLNALHKRSSSALALWKNCTKNQTDILYSFPFFKLMKNGKSMKDCRIALLLQAWVMLGQNRNYFRSLNVRDENNDK